MLLWQSVSLRRLFGAAPGRKLTDLSQLAIALLTVASQSTSANIRLSGGAWARKWSPENLLCVKKAIFTGTFPYMVRQCGLSPPWCPNPFAVSISPSSVVSTACLHVPDSRP